MFVWKFHLLVTINKNLMEHPAEKWHALFYKKKLVLIKQSLPLLPSPYPLVMANLLSVSVVLPVLSISDSCAHTICGLL